MKNLFKALTGFIPCALPITGAAQIISSEIVVTLSEAPNQSNYNIGDQFSMYVTYDGSSLSGVGEEIITVEGILSLSFEFGGSIYDETYDNASDYPRFYFTDSELVAVDYWNSNGLADGRDKSFFRFFKDQSFNYSPYGESEFTGNYLVVVPEPQTAIFLGVALGVTLLRRQRK